MRPTRPPHLPVRLAVVGEYHLGHVRFLDALVEQAGTRPGLATTFLPLEFAAASPVERVPPLSLSWSVRGSYRARTLLAGVDPDVVLFHTQTVALASVGHLRRVPGLISVDATPRNLDEVATAYDHAVAGPRVEAAKSWVVGRAFRAARGVVAWSTWVRDSLVRDYGVAADRVHVIRAGVELPPPPPEARRDGVRLLFVGGDFERKGGSALLAAFAQLRGDVELDIVTRSPVPGPPPGVRVHHGMQPRSAELAALSAAADIAVLPTRGDASPFAVLEALAAGLPVVTTRVGALEELVDPTCGVFVAPDDPGELAAALQALVDAPERRRALGRAARLRAEQDFDLARNAGRILDLAVATARGPQPYPSDGPRRLPAPGELVADGG